VQLLFAPPLNFDFARMSVAVGDTKRATKSDITMIELSPFAAWLRQRRRALDLTQAQLAQQTHYAISTIRKLEAGDLLPSHELAEQLAETLGVPTEQRAEFVRFARGHPNQFQAGATSADNAGVTATGARNAIAPTTLDQPASNTPIFNLPSPLTSLIGRERDLAEIVARLRQPKVRLLTLTGAPGAGKTRLSIAVADALRAEFADGVHFTALAPISDPQLVIPTLAHGLGVSEASAVESSLQPVPPQADSALLRQLSQFLRTKHLLLVLDNFEQVLGAAPALSLLLQRAPGVKMIVTSRELLRLYGEFEAPIAPFTLPATDKFDSFADVSENPALQLFVERAQSVQPLFELTPQNSAIVIRICARLDGLPLAIEMAAAQLKWQSLEAIWAQLANLRLDLRRTWRDANPRQQTLRAAIEWSYRLLPPVEQRLFNLLGLFAGGCTIDATEAVYAPDASIDPPGVVESRLHSLVERSLLQIRFDDTGEARYSMLATIRDYALEQLECSAEGEAAHRRQAAWGLALAQRAKTEMTGEHGKEWLQRLEAEHDTYRSILQRFVDGRGVDSDTGLLLAESLGRFWLRAGHWQEGRRWLESVLGRAVDGSASLRGRVLRQLASALINQGEQQAALRCAEESLALLRGTGDPMLLADILYVLGYICHHQRDFATARLHLEEGLELAEQTRQRVITQNILDVLAYLMLNLGHEERAAAYLTRLLDLAQRAGDRNAASNALNGLGELARLQGNDAEAVRCFEESLRQTHLAGARGAQTSKLSNLAHALLRQGDVERASELFRECLSMSDELGDKLVALQCLAGLAGAATGNGQWALAGQLCGAVERVLAADNLHFDRTDQRDFEITTAILRDRVDATRLVADRAAGEALTLQQAVELAMEGDN
jgi:predicted ATPase/transcriptional regulator with XRE-family HTH domain